MHADLKGFLVAVAAVLLALSLKGCTTKNIPIIKQGELARVKSQTVKPAKRPPSRTPAKTPLPEVEKQWAADRKGWADEADRSDTKSRILCAERGNKIIDPKTGKNTCHELRR